MKRLSLFACGAVLLGLTACEEYGSKNIDFGPGVLAGEDTTYKVNNVSQAQEKRVLVEEFTGVSCSNCPDAATVLKSIVDANGDKVVVIGYHPTNNGFTKLIDEHGYKSEYDFRQAKAEELGNSIFGGIPGMPIAVIGRQYVNNNYFVGRGEWSKLIEDRLKLTTPVNISITSSVDEGANEALAIVRIEYTENVSQKHNLHVAVIENDIIDAQKSVSEIFSDYKHEHVFRDMLTPLAGAVIPAKVEPKEPGKVYERKFTISINEKWKVENCKVIAFITNDEAGDNEVVQVAEVNINN